MLFMVGSMAFTMSWGQSMMKREGTDIKTSAEVLEELIAFTCAGLAAREVTGMSNPLHRQEQETL